MQQYAGIYLLQIYTTYFGCPSHPSSGVHKTVATACGTGHSISATTFLQRGLIRPRWRKVVELLLWPVLQAVDTVLCTPDDGCLDTRNMQSKFAVNKYLRTVGCCWILLIQSHDARNHEYKILINCYCFMQLVFISFISMMHGQTNIKSRFNISREIGVMVQLQKPFIF